MEILKLHTIHGPNVYHNRPVICMKLDIKEWVETASNEIPDFNKKLLKLLPGLQKHTCSPGYEGGFCERLARGTYMAHITEHIAIELANMCGMDVAYGKSKYAGTPGHYFVVTRFTNEEAMKECLRCAVKTLNAFLSHQSVDLTKDLKNIKDIYASTKLGPSGNAIYQAALKRGIPVTRVGSNSLLNLGTGKYRKRVQAAVTDRTSLIATELVQDKETTKNILSAASIPVPEGTVVTSADEIRAALESFEGPYAVKPLDGHHGNGVCLNLKTYDDVLKAFNIAREHCSSVIIEQMCEGKDYRVLVIDGKLVAAAERRPPVVTGDGKSNITELITQLNLDPRRGNGHGNILTRVEVDDVLLECLKKQGLNLQSVIPMGKEIVLRDNANLSSGGTSKDVTDEMHPEVRFACERIARIVGLDICGIDVIHRNISESMNKYFKIIEVNAGPGLRMHLDPSEGQKRAVGEAIVDMLYPAGAPTRIPIVSVTGTNGKTTTVRMLGKILGNKAGTCVGMTTTDGIWIGAQKVQSGDTTGPISSRLVLSDPTVDLAVLEVARGGLLRSGLAYEWSDVGVITNIRPDHIGQDGIETLEDLVWIKSLVAERVKEDGHLILNADDPESLNVRNNKKIKGSARKIVLYSVNATNPELINHVAAGGDAFWFEDGWLCAYYNQQSYRFIEANELPITMNGKAIFQVSNVLASLAAGLYMGAPIQQSIEALKSFHGSFDNPGRANLYKLREGYLFLDYGHNTDAISAFGKMLRQWDGYKTTAILGLPGDRHDHILIEATQTAANIFDRLILRDDYDLRGRKQGEIPDLMEKVVKEYRPDIQCEKSLDEETALEHALKTIQPNEVVAVFYDTLDPILKLIRQYDPIPIHTLPELTTAQDGENEFESILRIETPRSMNYEIGANS